MQFLRQLKEKHERLKNRIHSFRIPLSPTGMGLKQKYFYSTLHRLL